MILSCLLFLSAYSAVLAPQIPTLFIDHALVQSMIQIVDEEKNLIAGYWEILEQEQLIQFVPEKNWQKGNYQVVIDSRLEDVAGNNLQTLLDQIELDKEKNINSHRIIDFKI